MDLSITSSNGSVSLQLKFDRSQTVHFGGDTSVGVEMSRNATHLDFQVCLTIEIY